MITLEMKPLILQLYKNWAYLVYNRFDSGKKCNAWTSVCRGCGYDGHFEARRLLLNDSHKEESVKSNLCLLAVN